MYAKGDMITRQQGMGHSSIVMTAAYTVPLEAEMEKMFQSFQLWEKEEKIIEFP
jgi:hypothetical protein